MIKGGSVELIDHRGQRRRLGAGTPDVAIRINDPWLTWRALLDPSVALGEAFMDGRLEIERGTLYDLVSLFARSGARTGRGGGLWRLLTHWRKRNGRRRSRANVAHHYDLSHDLYRRFLDRDLQYSCAVFASDHGDIDRAQEEKKRRLGNKLLLKPGARVLDIGSGWGGLALSLARRAEVEVLGITLSVEQLKIARERAKAEGLDHRVRFELADYRDIAGPFDRIISVGMFEHVGLHRYGAFFDRIGELLAPDGVAVVHAIGRSDGPGVTNRWLEKYIFPGGYSPALSEVLPHVERAGLWVTDIEILRLHYAETLKAWRQRFNAARAEIARLYDERFCRMWELYLIGSELAFRVGGHMVWQLQLAKDVATVPLTRDYMLAPDQPSRLRTQAAAVAGE